MSIDIVMPNLGFDTQEARIIEWHKQPGDSVRKGELIAVVESDKSNVDLESIADGVVLEHVFQAGEAAPVGAVIARIGQADERRIGTPPAGKSETSQQTAPVERAESPGKQIAAISPVARRFAEENGVDLAAIRGSGGRITRKDVEAALKTEPASKQDRGGQHTVFALPKVRKAAREAGIDLGTVQGSGSRGQITLADLRLYQQQQHARPEATLTVESQVSTAAQSPLTEPSAGAREVPISRIRQTIGQRLRKSMQEAPHFYVAGEFDLEPVLSTLKGLPEPRPRINDVMQYLTVQTLLKVPQLNATYENDRLFQHQAVHLAVAVGLEDGLLTPVIPNAERYSLTGLSAESRALLERLRANRLRPQDLTGGTFTISNLGVVKQVDQFTAVINPPQVAILAVGTIKQRPFVIDGGLFVRHTVRLTLSGDHRIVDGMILAQFMAAFQDEVNHFSRQHAH